MKKNKYLKLTVFALLISIVLTVWSCNNTEEVITLRDIDTMITIMEKQKHLITETSLSQLCKWQNKLYSVRILIEQDSMIIATQDFYLLCDSIVNYQADLLTGREIQETYGDFEYLRSNMQHR